MESGTAVENMNGKVCVVTGGASGIGGGIAKALAARGATVVVVGRNAEKECFHPGVIVGTDFGVGMPWIMRKLGPLAAKLTGFGVSLEEGIDTPVWLASSREVEGVTGKFYIKRKEEQTPKQTYDRDVATRLWAGCERLTGTAG